MSTSLNIVSHAGVPLPKAYGANKNEIIEGIKHNKIMERLLLGFSGSFVPLEALAILSPLTSENITSGEMLVSNILTIGATVGFGWVGLKFRKARKVSEKSLESIPVATKIMTAGSERNPRRIEGFEEDHDYPYVEWDEAFLNYLPTTLNLDVEHNSHKMYVNAQSLTTKALNATRYVARGTSFNTGNKTSYALINGSKDVPENRNILILSKG